MVGAGWGWVVTTASGTVSIKVLASGGLRTMTLVFLRRKLPTDSTSTCFTLKLSASPLFSQFLSPEYTLPPPSYPRTSWGQLPADPRKRGTWRAFIFDLYFDSDALGGNSGAGADVGENAYFRPLL